MNLRHADQPPSFRRLALAPPASECRFPLALIAHNRPNGFGLTLNTETTCDWTADEATVPFNPVASQVLKVGKQAISLQAGNRYYAARPRRWIRLGVALSCGTAVPE
jgi:hypothetical protein